jgi:hypothetical protein
MLYLIFPFLSLISLGVYNCCRIYPNGQYWLPDLGKLFRFVKQSLGPGQYDFAGTLIQHISILCRYGFRDERRKPNFLGKGRCGCCSHLLVLAVLMWYVLTRSPTDLSHYPGDIFFSIYLSYSYICLGCIRLELSQTYTNYRNGCDVVHR